MYSRSTVFEYLKVAKNKTQTLRSNYYTKVNEPIYFCFKLLKYNTNDKKTNYDLACPFRYQQAPACGYMMIHIYTSAARSFQKFIIIINFNNKKGIYWFA